MSGAPTTDAVWFNPAVGVAGDMVIAALLDAGADEGTVREQLTALDLDGWQLHVEPTTRCQLTATSVCVEHDEGHHHRSWSRIDAMLAAAPLRPRVSEGARRTFRALAVAEAAVHGIEIDEVHFHEVGAIDAIVDIVGAWAALDSLGAEVVASAPIGLGTGVVAMAHGQVPVPAPATLELLIGLPTVPVEQPGETATPTGVALLATMADQWGSLPAGRIAASGRGAGSRDPEAYANVLGAVRVERIEPGAFEAVEFEAGAVEAVVIESNVDDVTPEVLGHLVGRLLEQGADDAWVTPIVMKKGRPAHMVSALCRPGIEAALRRTIAAETGTLGIRRRVVDKFELDRRTEQVCVHDDVVRIKVGPHGAKPEHDDVARIAERVGRPLREVAAEAIRSWTSGGERTPGT